MERFPFPAVIGQEELQSALLVNAVNPSVGGVLIRGERGTGKSSAVRGLQRVLPDIPVVADCPFGCPPDDPANQCQKCRQRSAVETERVSTPVVDLPLGATEDRVVGSLDIEQALNEGVSALDPGLLARANRGILYVDEVNLLDDYLVDLLLDAAASGVNRVEREGVSVEHPANFVLVGTMNPEEGSLRPQFVDRFGLRVDIAAPDDPEERAAIIEVAETFDRSPTRVTERYEPEERRLRERVVAAREQYAEVTLGDDLRTSIATVCVGAGVEGSRGDIATARCARALAALDGRTDVTEPDVRRAAGLALPHRIPNSPFDDPVDVDEVLRDCFDGDASTPATPGDEERDSEPDFDGNVDPDDTSRGGSENRRNEGVFGSAARRLKDFF